MEHVLKDIAFYVKKTYNTLHSCHNFPAGSRQAARGARVCETSLIQVSAKAPFTVLLLQFNSLDAEICIFRHDYVHIMATDP